MNLESTCKIWRQRPQKEVGMMCTGTLVASKWILTAAHCGGGPKDKDSTFFVSCEGDHHQKLVPVKEVHRHPGFEFGNRSHDVALFELAAEIDQEQMSFVPSQEEVERFVKDARKHHRFQVRTRDGGVSGAFGRSRFFKEYSLEGEEDPVVHCAAVGMGMDENDKYGHLQSQGLNLIYFLDLGLNYVLLPYNEGAHGFYFRPGDSGGPLLCQFKGSTETFVLGVHSHSMEETKLSFSTPVFRYFEWIREVIW